MTMTVYLCVAFIGKKTGFIPVSAQFTKHTVHQVEDTSSAHYTQV